MSNFKNILLFSGLLIISGIINAQGGPFGNARNDLPSFPVPYQYGNIPVNLATGAPSINIPLWEASSGNLSVPVSVSYGSNGLRPSDTPTEAGLQWQLNAGGSIVQIARGCSPFIIWENQDSIQNPSAYFMSGIVNGLKDSEPDIYKVNAPGLKVDFMLTEDYGFLTLTESDVKIEYTFNNPAPFYHHGFKITSNNGTKYYFNKIQVNYYYEPPYSNIDQAKLSETGKWYLTKIESSDNVHYINFNYSVYPYEDYHDYSYLFCYGHDVYIGYDSYTTHYILFEKEKVKLLSVESEQETINFSYFTPEEYNSPYEPYTLNGQTLDNTEKFIKKVEIKNKANELIKSYFFDYYVNQNNRVFLSEIKEKSSAGDSLPPYRFNYYNPENTGEVFSSVRDFWGFYNLYCEGDFIGKMFSKYTYNGLLKEVHYPTGGYTKFYYEPNTYCFDTLETSPWYNENWKSTLNKYGYFNYDNLRAGGYRLRKVENISGNIIKSKIFDYTINGKSSGRLTVYPRHEIIDTLFNSGWNNGYTIMHTISTNHFGIEQGYVLYEKITVFLKKEMLYEDSTNLSESNGKTEYLYKIPEPVYSTNKDEDFPYDIVLFPNNEAGMLKQKTVYDKDNNIISKQITDYNITVNENNKRTGLKVIPKRKDGNYANMYSDFYKAWYDIKQKSIKLNNQTSKSYSSDGSGVSTENTVSYSYTRNGEKRLFPTKITTVKSKEKEDIIETYLYYPVDFAGDNGVFDKMLERNILSPVIKKEVFKNGEKISGEKTVFKFHITTAGDTLIVPASKSIWEDNAYKTVLWFTEYSDKGNLLSSLSFDFVPVSYIYNSDETEIIASVTNANHNEIYHNSFEEDENLNLIRIAKTGNKSFSGNYTFTLPKFPGEYILSYWKFISGKWKYFETKITNPGFGAEYTINSSNIIDEIRVYPPDAFMSTATYKSLIGKTSETDANNITVYYEYDDFGRLIKVLDQDKNLIKENEYNLETTSFRISGENELISNCSQELTVETSETNKNIAYEWFDDYCGGNKISSSKQITIGSSNINEEKTYFARIKIDGRCSECAEHTVTVVKPYFTLPEDGYYDIVLGYSYYGINVNTQGDTINLNDLYRGCNNFETWLWSDNYNGTDWLHIENNILIVDPCTETEYNEICENCRVALVTLEDDTYNDVKIGFFIKQYE